MLKELRSDRKTADDDADGELGPAPESHEFQIVALVERFGNLIAVVSAHYGRHASPESQCLSARLLRLPLQGAL